MKMLLKKRVWVSFLLAALLLSAVFPGIAAADPATTLTLDDVTVNEGVGTATITGHLENAPETAITVTLSNGATLTFAVGSTVATSTPFVAQGEDPYIDSESYAVSVISTTGGNFESLDTSDTAIVTVNDLGPTAVLTGDTVLDEGQTGSYDASGSTSSPDAIVLYEWDWDYDGSTFIPSGDTGAVQTHSWNDDGSYTVAVRVTDDDGSTDITVIIVTVNPVNELPVADAGGPYGGNEGDDISLDASGSYDPDDGIISYEWDLDSDGQYDDAVGETTTLVFNDNGIYTVGLKVTDSYGEYDTDTTTVTVNDLGPTAVLTGDTLLDEDQIGSYDASGSTSSPDSIVICEWDWDYDGSTFNPSGDTGAVQTHTWNDNGACIVAVRVTDDDGSTDIATITVIVENPPPEVMVENLSEDIDAMELPPSTEKSLNASLDTANKVLKDSNLKNDVAAINALKAFINKIEAQRGKKISENDADKLIAKAQEIIEELSGGT